MSLCPEHRPPGGGRDLAQRSINDAVSERFDQSQDSSVVALLDSCGRRIVIQEAIWAVQPQVGVFGAQHCCELLGYIGKLKESLPCSSVWDRLTGEIPGDRPCARPGDRG